MWNFERFIIEETLDEFDQLFLYNARKDIEKFLKEKNKRCVLVFPPVNSRRRYLLHQLGKFLFKLETFSVGETYYRQLVICHSTQSNSCKEISETILPIMEHTRKGAISKSKRVYRPAAPLYIPPAGRRKPIDKTSENIPAVTQRISHNITPQQHIYKEECQQCRQREEKENKGEVQQYPNKNECNNVPDVNVIKLSDNSESTTSKPVTEVNQQLLNISINNNRLNDIDKNENDQDQAELFRASEEINRKNKRIIKQTFNHSDILIISDDNKKCDKEPVESWEELLEEKNVMDIIEKIGNVEICHVEENYDKLKVKTSLEGELAHVLELYNFPKEFQTRDLVTILDSHTSGSYHIKWVDDNHALAVFTSGFAATRMLSLSHPLLKLRPMTEASKQSISKAVRYPNAMMPSAVRPQTCPQTARRMVTGALGLKLTNTREERAKELKILKEAREKKRLSARQQDDAWEGKTSTN